MAQLFFAWAPKNAELSRFENLHTFQDTNFASFFILVDAARKYDKETVWTRVLLQSMIDYVTSSVDLPTLIKKIDLDSK